MDANWSEYVNFLLCTGTELNIEGIISNITKVSVNLLLRNDSAFYY